MCRSRHALVPVGLQRRFLNNGLGAGRLQALPLARWLNFSLEQRSQQMAMAMLFLLGAMAEQRHRLLFREILE